VGRRPLLFLAKEEIQKVEEGERDNKEISERACKRKMKKKKNKRWAHHAREREPQMRERVRKRGRERENK
jgi:hypothetical protein